MSNHYDKLCNTRPTRTSPRYYEEEDELPCCPCMKRHMERMRDAQRDYSYLSSGIDYNEVKAALSGK